MRKADNINMNLKKVIVGIAKRSANAEANSACCFLGYQPKEPNTIKKLRKF